MSDKVALPLPSGHVAIIDAEDKPKTEPYRWYLCQTSRKTGKPKCYVTGYVPQAGRPSLYLHRLIMDAPKGCIVDHINGDTLDCRKDNLRLATHKINAHNRVPNITYGGQPCASKFRGVSLERRTGKWIAVIGFEGARYHLSTFENEIEAAEAYDDFSYWLHPESTFRNIPDRQPREFRGTVYVTQDCVGIKAAVQSFKQNILCKKLTQK